MTGGSRIIFNRIVPTLLLASLLPFVHRDLARSVESQATDPICEPFQDWKHDIPFWPDTKIHARQGAVPEGYPEYWQHVQTSLWISEGGIHHEEEELSDVAGASIWAEGDDAIAKSEPETTTRGTVMRHLDFVDGYAVNHETTPCFGPGH
ncbi:MAG: hypothetical protein MUD17_08155 [Gemmatimonadaceae bacterium]|jgi:hypothetical protein|nr:hypothetical protein [Gemmatimonadaceae bacterium]